MNGKITIETDLLRRWADGIDEAYGLVVEAKFEAALWALKILSAAIRDECETGEALAERTVDTNREYEAEAERKANRAAFERAQARVGKKTSWSSSSAHPPLTRTENGGLERSR